MKKTSKKEYILYCIILILFIVLTTVISLKHEYWADELQAWLLAKDTSIKELLSTYLRLEGHPILYFSILKAFQLFGLKLSFFRIISLLFSTLGVAIFLFKADYKWYIKILIPFTFFIFYQYTIITRSYCLILPLLSLLAIIWSKRQKYYWLFTIILILLINLESFTFLLAGSIYLLELISFLKNKKKSKKLIPYLIIIFLSFLVTSIYMFPISTQNVIGRVRHNSSIAGGFFMPYQANHLLEILSPIVSIFILSYFYLLYRKYQKKEQLIEAILFFIPIVLFNLLIYGNYRHEGIYFLIILFIGWIHKLDKIKSFRIFIIFSCVIQIFWSFKSSIADYQNKYSIALEASKFIKKYDYEKLKIYASGFKNVEINAYFNQNIYYNWSPNKRFFYWHEENKFNKTSLKAQSIIKNDVDMLIYYYSESENDYEKLKELYNTYTFTAKSYFKDTINDDLTITIFVKKEIDNKT